MRKLYEKLGRIWVVSISGIVAGICLSALLTTMHNALPPSVPGIISMQLAFTKEKLIAILNEWGNALRIYLKIMWIDYIYAVAYAVFLSGLFSLASRTEGKEPGKLSLLIFSFPFIAGFLDWVENSLHLSLFSKYQLLSQGTVLFVSFISLIKWFLALSSIVAILFYLCKKAIKTMKV